MHHHEPPQPPPKTNKAYGDLILEALQVIYQQGRTIMATLADLELQVKQNTSVEASAVTLIQGLSAQLQAAIAAGDPVKVQELADTLKASGDALAAAVTANTPAAPAVATPPAPAATETAPAADATAAPPA